MYTNSPLVVYTKLSPNNSGQRTHTTVIGYMVSEGLTDAAHKDDEGEKSPG